MKLLQILPVFWVLNIQLSKSFFIIHIISWGWFLRKQRKSRSTSLFVLKPALPFEISQHLEKFPVTIRMYFMFWPCMYTFVVIYCFTFCSHIWCFRSNQRRSNPWGYVKYFYLKNFQYESCNFMFYIPFMKQPQKSPKVKPGMLTVAVTRTSFAVLLLFEAGPAWFLMILTLLSIWLNWREDGFGVKTLA